MQCTYNVTSWRVRVINYCCRRKATLRSFCIVSAHIAVKDDFMAISCRRKRCLHAKFLMFLSYCNQTGFCLTDFNKTLPITQFHNTLSSGSNLFQTNGRRTDTTKLRVAFRNFANAPKKSLVVTTIAKPTGCVAPKCCRTLLLLMNHNEGQSRKSLTKERYASTVLCSQYGCNLSR